MAEKKTAKKETKKTTTKKAEKETKTAKKAAPKKTKVEWHDGYPKETGLFHCRQGKEETVMRHLYCDMTCKHKWATVAGTIPCGEAIEWEGKPLGLEEVQKLFG